MEVTETLDVDAKSLFDVIVRSYAADAEEARGKKVPTSKIKCGFTFHKDLKGTPATCKVTEFAPPNIFTYIETQRSKNTGASLRARLGETLGGGHGRRGIRKRLHQMEGYIIAQSYGVDEDVPEFGDGE